jgi:hypothetical protein
LENNITKFGLTPEKIFNVDECVFSTVQKRQHKIVAQKGKYEVGVVASGRRGVCAVSTADVYIPPMTIFKAKNWNNVFGSVPFYVTGIWPVDLHVFQELHFAPAVALLPADTAQSSSSETQTS